MPTLSATEARTELCRPIERTSPSHELIVITGKRDDVVLISEGDNTLKIIRMWTHHNE
jgi:PHD/YefM family antitoxin component YafN of YafNO toxin-antitoxin module